jgi:hypothetical protein
VKRAYYACLTIAILSARWIKAKVTGQPYDSGMD